MALWACPGYIPVKTENNTDLHTPTLSQALLPFSLKYRSTSLLWKPCNKIRMQKKTRNISLITIWLKKYSVVHIITGTWCQQFHHRYQNLQVPKVLMGRWLSQCDTYQPKVRTEFRSSEPNKCQVVMVAHLNPNVWEADTVEPQSKKTSYDQWAVLNQESKRYPISALRLHMLTHTNMCTCIDMHPCTYTHGHAYIWKCYLHKTVTYSYIFSRFIT